MIVATTTDIAWLAGIVDGEGCFSVKRPLVLENGKRQGSRTSYQLWLVVCNTSKPMMDRMSQILTEMRIKHPAIRKVWKGERATRWQYWLSITRKQELLDLTEVLMPYLIAKRHEAEIVCYLLDKAVKEKAYSFTALDKFLLEKMSVIKKNGGEAPADLLKSIREVIPSQAFCGHQETGEQTEGVETRRVSPNNNLAHECPTPALN